MNNLNIMNVVNIHIHTNRWVERGNVRYSTTYIYTDKDGHEMDVTIFSREHPGQITQNADDREIVK